MRVPVQTMRCIYLFCSLRSLLSRWLFDLCNTWYLQKRKYTYMLGYCYCGEQIIFDWISDYYYATNILAQNFLPFSTFVLHVLQLQFLHSKSVDCVSIDILWIYFRKLYWPNLIINFFFWKWVFCFYGQLNIFWERKKGLIINSWFSHTQR